MRTRLVWAVTLVMLLIGADRAAAQNASVTGTVTDQSGGVMPGAVVTAHNQETGLARTATTSDNGQFRVPALPPGSYLVTAELDGFTKEQVEGLVLVIDQTATINFSMKPAAVAETITVASDAALVDTTASTVSTSVSNQQIQDLPVASRRWIDLAMLTPGTSQDNIRGFFYRGNVNIGGGAREYSNGFVVDGVNNTWAQMGEPRQNFAMDAIREFKVSTSNYKAEYGLATGGLLTVVSKSGTNQLHGSGLLFVRDKALTARSYFEAVKPDFRRYQYGGTLGGPIVRNRTHFFAAYEGTDENVFYTVSTAGAWPQYDGTYASDQNRWTYSSKVDHQLTPTQTLFVRYGQENEYRPVVTTGGRTHPTNSFDFAVPRSSAVVGHTWVLSPRALNDFRFQYAYAKYEVSPPYSHGSWEPGDFGADRLSLLHARLQLSDDLGRRLRQQPDGTGSARRTEERLLLSDEQVGRHASVEDGRRLQPRVVLVRQPELAARLLDVPARRAVRRQRSHARGPTQYQNTLPTYADIPVTHLSAYLQDDWQIGRGADAQPRAPLRRAVRLVQRGHRRICRRASPRSSGPASASRLPIPFLEGSDRRGDRNNFGPRVGVAWDPWQSGRTNIHGGLRHVLRQHAHAAELRRADVAAGEDDHHPATRASPIRSRAARATSSSPRRRRTSSCCDNDTVNPYAHQVNAGVTQMLTSELALTADVTTVFRYSDRNIVDLNLPEPPGPATRVRPYPQFAPRRSSASRPPTTPTRRCW